MARKGIKWTQEQIDNRTEAIRKAKAGKKYTAWNKGLTKENNEILRNKAEKAKGKTYYDKLIERGIDPIEAKKIYEEWKIKVTKKFKKYNEQPEEIKQKRNLALKGKLKGRRFSKRTLEKMREASNHKSYIEKLIDKGYTLEEANALRQQVVEKSKATKRTNASVKGGKSKYYETPIGKVQGTYELAYINKLLEEKLVLPINKPKGIKTLYGDYFPDFEFPNKFIEIKSNFTFDVFRGVQPNINGKLDTVQKQKVEWVSTNIKPVEVLVGTLQNKKVVFITEKEYLERNV